MSKNIIQKIGINADKLIRKIRKQKQKDKEIEAKIEEHIEKEKSDVSPFYYENVISRILIIFVITYFTIDKL